MFRNYFKTAFRNLARNKVYSVINIAGLSLGLSCAMLIILYVKDEVSYDRFQKNIAHTYLVGRNMINKTDGQIGGTDGYTGYVQGPLFKDAIPGIESYVRILRGQIDYKKGADIESQQVYYVDPNFFTVFSFPLISGSPANVLNDLHSVVITEEFAKKQFGTSDAVGKLIQINDGGSFTPYLVSGVAKNCPQNSSIKFQVLFPLNVSNADLQNKDAWGTSILNTFVIVHKNADSRAVIEQMKRLSETTNEADNKLRGAAGDQRLTSVYTLQPFKNLHLSKDYVAYELSDASSPVFSYILGSIAIFILLIACINFVNLTIARSVKRAKEIGIRKVVGGDRKQLIIQFLSESFLLCFISFVAAAMVVQLVLPLFNQLSNKALSLSYLTDTTLAAGYVMLFLVTSFLAGFYPALILSGYQPVQTLYGKFMLAGKNYLQRSLVIFQFTLASFLIIATLTIVSQVNYLTSKNLGYDDTNLLVINNWGITKEQVKLFKEEIMKSPDVTGVTAKDMGWDNGQTKVANGNEVAFVRETVDENFIPLLKVPVVQGRNFSSGFGADSIQSVLVNETFVKQAAWKHPIGQVITIGQDNPEKFTVIGVVKDYYYQPLHQVIKAQIFSLKPGRVLGNLIVKIDPSAKGESLRRIEQVYKKIFPVSAFSYFFKDQDNLQNYAAETKWKQVLLFSALLTIFISCIGLFGLSVLSAEKRTKEIGIRKVLGASVSSLVTVLSKDFLKLVGIALAIAIPITWIAASKWLENYPFRFNLSWKLFAFAACLVIVVALITTSFQAIKAAIANPVKSLRND